MRYKIYKVKGSDRDLWGIVENETIAIAITAALRQCISPYWEFSFEPYEKIDEEKLDKIIDDFWNKRAFTEQEYAMVKEASKEIIRGIEEGYITY